MKTTLNAIREHSPCSEGRGAMRKEFEKELKINDYTTCGVYEKCFNAGYTSRDAYIEQFEVDYNELSIELAECKAREAALMGQKPFGFWHTGETYEESDFFLASEGGDVRCESCIVLYTHPIPADEGYVLVPVEPSPEMLNAAYYVSHDGCKTEDEMITRSYKAMLKAAKGEVK